MSATSNAEPEGVVSKVKVKKQIKTIVEDLETILGDLKDVAKELKEVVHEIDSLTCDLRLEEEMTDSSKTDTLNSSSSSTATTGSSVDKTRLYLDANAAAIIIPPGPPPPTATALLAPTTVLTVLKRPRPPLPPPRLTPLKADDPPGWNVPLMQSPGNLFAKTNGTLVRNGGVFPRKLGRDSSCCRGDGGRSERVPAPMPLLRHEKNKCPQATRERVRFSEKVQYHGYCPDCDLRYDVDGADVRPQSELADARLSPVHRCSSPPSPPPRLALENGGGGAGLPDGRHGGRNAPPALCAPPPPPPRQTSAKPQKTILRKSTTTTV